MSSIPKRAAVAAALAAFASPTFAQNFNVDAGAGPMANGAPSNSYSAAGGQNGHWNEWDVETTMTLTDVSGALTGVQISRAGGSTNLLNNWASTSGDDEALLDTCQDLGNLTSNKTTYTITGLSNGNYTVYIYAWTPYNPNQNFTNVRIIGGTAGNQTVGGTWSGSHANLVTYAVDTYDVTTGTMQIRGVPTLGTWGSINGLQIKQSASCGSGPVNYCTPGTSADGCTADMSAAGTASASGIGTFTLTATDVSGDKDGLFFAGTNGQQANGWGNGTSFQCVTPPVKRYGLLGKTGTAGLCDGTFSQEINALWQAFPSKNPGAGAVVQAQCWYRDPANTSNQTTSLSDAIEFTVCP